MDVLKTVWDSYENHTENGSPLILKKSAETTYFCLSCFRILQHTSVQHSITTKEQTWRNRKNCKI